MMEAPGGISTVELQICRALDRHPLGTAHVDVWLAGDASTLDVHEEAVATFFQACEAVGGYRRAGIGSADWE